jgi:xanthine dehydrogenase molybdenum-binding subunit
MTNQITLTVNNTNYSLPAIPGETLSSLLRQRLHLTGTKVACGEGICGACTVLLDGKPVVSCVFPAERADGRSVLTIEGLAQRVNQELQLHPLQEAFVEYGAVQCGFCTPGQIMSAYALLKRNPNPNRAEIATALKNKLCRCGSYLAIERAILAAARTLLTGEPLSSPLIPDSIHPHTVIGHSHFRPDAVPKVTGEALFTDDLMLEGMLYARVRRAGIPHAFLTRLDVSKARELEGVQAVLTAADIPGEHLHGLIYNDWPVMVGIGERVRYEGDALAIVAAETQQIADQAVALIEAEFDPQPIISDPIQARQPGQPQLHPNGNLLKHIRVRKGDIEAGFAAAEVILEKTFHTQTTDHAFMEPECSLAMLTPDGRMQIYVGSQIPYSDRAQVARALGWPEVRVHIAGQLMGGGFGGKEDIAGQIHAALLANATGRPVKLLFDRRESFLVHPKRHATHIRVKIGAKKDGYILAVETELYGDTGAYASLGEQVMTRATTHSSGPYDVPHVRADCYAMYTNNPPAGAFRGFGVTQSSFAVESMMDMLAEKLGMDPIELRRLNALRLGSVTNTSQELKESVGLLECIDKVVDEMRKSNPDPFKPRVADPAQPNRVRAWGFAAAYKNTGLGGGAEDCSGADVELHDDGSFEVRSSAAELGQGLVTVMRMIVAEELAAPPELVRVLVMDTDLTPDGGPTTASRQTYMTGNASRFAAIALRDRITALAAEKFNLPPVEIQFRDGAVHAGDQSMTFAEVAREMKAAGQPPHVRYVYSAPPTQPLGEGGDMHFAFTFGVQAAEVEVDTLSGQVRVLKVIAANDVGIAINPLGLQGQVEGGIMMGIGNCLTEQLNVENGHVLTEHLSQYHIPGFQLTPEITSIVVEHPTSEGPYGAKGVGEICSIPTTPAITNAIYNAIGLRVNRTPVDPELIKKKQT